MCLSQFLVPIIQSFILYERISQGKIKIVKCKENDDHVYQNVSLKFKIH
jgi:hypothetical protein